MGASSQADVVEVASPAVVYPRHDGARRLHRRRGRRHHVTAEFIDVDHPLIARALLRHIVEHADIVGEDHKGRAVTRFEFAAEPWPIDKLAVVAADAEMEEAAVE